MIRSGIADARDFRTPDSEDQILYILILYILILYILILYILCIDVNNP